MPIAFNTPLSNQIQAFPQALERAAKIKMLVLDVDGVLTNGSIFLGSDGKEFQKAFDIQDGHGIKLLQGCGIPCAVITGRHSKMISVRCEELGITHLFMGVTHKNIALAELLKRVNLNVEDLAVMGDDWPDIPMMLKARLIIAPAQAHTEVLSMAHYVTHHSGGKGAVREVCDLILKAQNYYEPLLQAIKNQNSS
jgi:3-deoxy-D-manno-octulosonate 8-phosphate phosphatase (KDO 8-P phosphatase)